MTLQRWMILSIAVLTIATQTAPARAADCEGWVSDGDFWPSVTTGGVKTCLAAGESVEARDEEGYTPLHSAAALGNAETVVTLLGAGATLEARTKAGLTPLHVAAFTGNIETVTALLDAGAEPEARSADSSTPLYFAAISGDTETVTALRKAGATLGPLTEKGLKFPVDIPQIPNTVMMSAAGTTLQEAGTKQGLYQATQDHSKIAVAPMFFPALGSTAIRILPSAAKRFAVMLSVEVLVALGVELIKAASAQVALAFDKSIIENKLLHLAVRQNSVVGIGVQTKADWTPLHSAAFGGKTETITALLKAGAPVEARDKHGRTPLHVAAHGGNAETITILLEAKAVPDARSEKGRTPLHFAASGSNDATIPALSKAGGGLEVRAKYDLTPLHYAASQGTAKTVMALLKAGATPKAQGMGGAMPIDLAEGNPKLKGTNAYWKLHEARFE